MRKWKKMITVEGKGPGSYVETLTIRARGKLPTPVRLRQTPRPTPREKPGETPVICYGADFRVTPLPKISRPPDDKVSKSCWATTKFGIDCRLQRNRSVLRLETQRYRDEGGKLQTG